MLPDGTPAKGAMSGSSHALTSYLPRRLVAQLASDPASVRTPESFQAATLLADLSGFTALAGDLSAEGAAGAEKLTSILASSLGRLVDLVYSMGGDVVAFAGDAVMAVWPADDEDELLLSARRAVLCASRAHGLIEGWEAHPGHTVTLRIGVGVGPCSLTSLGDEDERWGWVAAGPAMTSVGHAERCAKPGATVLSDDVVTLLAGEIATMPAEGGALLLDASALRPDPAPVAEPLDDSALAAHVRPYLPAAVLARIDTGHGEWLAELRPVTTIFVNFPDLDPWRTADAQIALSLVGSMKRTMEVLGGALHKVLVDDKGTTAVLAFGLPPLSHDDDAVRAVRAAIRIRERIAAEGVAFGIGVTSGRAFCGAYGTDRRREYTMLGDSVNLAARLMQLADGEVWCDSPTARSAVSRFRFEDLGPRDVKGKAEPVRVHQAVGALDATGRHEVLLTGRAEALSGRIEPVSSSGGWDTLQGALMTPLTESDFTGELSDAHSAPALQIVRIVGREAQEQVLRDRLDHLQQGERGLVLIEGEAGMGKSLLVATLQRACAHERVPFLVGSADPVRSLEPYHGWREILLPLFRGDPEARQQRLAAWFPEGSHLSEWTPLLGPVLGLPSELFEDTDAVRAMNGPQRAAATRDLLVAALTRTTEEEPVVVVLDDAHWLDAASWQLALTAARVVPDLLLVLCLRPMDDPPRAFKEISDLPGARRVRLDALPDRSVAELASRFLGVASLEPPVEDLVVSRAGGNPFFCEEVVYALTESGALKLNGVARFADGRGPSTVNLPETLQGVVTSRLDRLPPEEQLTLKVASVLGRSFGIDTLLAVHPVDTPEEELRSQLDHLAELDLCPKDVDTGEQRIHSFKHALVQEACYELLVLGKRRDLHAAAAAHYEANPPDDGPNAARLAHHWRNAGEPLRALEHLEAAGFAALDNGADKDALGTLDAACELVNDLSGTQLMEVGPVRRAEMLRARGTALHGVGRQDESAESLRRALKSLGFSLPRTPLGWTLRLLLEGARQALYRVIPRALRWRARRTKHPRLKAASQAASWYANASYFRVEPLPWLAAGLWSANLAENAEAPDIAGTAYVNLANIFGTLHLRPLERTYMRLAALSPERRVDNIAHSSKAVVEMLHAEWDAARATILEGTAKSRASGDWWALGNGLTILALIDYYTAPIETCLATFDEVARTMAERDHPAQECYGLVFCVPALLSLGRVEGARNRLQLGAGRLDSFDYFGRLSWHAAMAALHLRDDRPEDAVAAADRALTMFADKPLMLFTYGGPFLLVAEVLLTVFEAGSAGRYGREDLRALAKTAVANLRQGAITFRYFQPRALLAKGILQAIEGKSPDAALDKALAAAQRWSQPWDEGRIQAEIARRAPAGSPRAAAAATAARAILEPMGAHADLDGVP